MRSYKRSAALIQLLLGLGVAGSPLSTAEAPLPASGGLLIPLYIYPGEDPEANRAYRLLTETARSYPTLSVIAIVNPDNGPGRAVDPAYQRGVAYLAEHGVTVAGYVAEGFGERSLRKLRREIRAWSRLYPEVELIFLDETEAYEEESAWKHRGEDRYRALSRYTRRAGMNGIVANPGRIVPSFYLTSGHFRIVVVYENNRHPSEAEIRSIEELRTGNEASKAVLLYGEEIWDSELFRRVAGIAEYLFVNDHTLDVRGGGSYPWNYLPENLPTQAEIIHEGG